MKIKVCVEPTPFKNHLILVPSLKESIQTVLGLVHHKGVLYIHHVNQNKSLLLLKERFVWNYTMEETLYCGSLKKPFSYRNHLQKFSEQLSLKKHFGSRHVNVSVKKALIM